MKKSRIILLTALVLATVFILCSCSGKKDEVLTEAKYYTVTFNSEGSAVESAKVIEGGTVSEPAEPEREGYIFDGWADSKGNDFSFELEKITSDVLLYARWIEASRVFGYTTVENTPNAVISELKSDFSKTVRVPKIINGLTVIGIGEGVFDGKTTEDITKIILPETVTRIDKNAFRACSGIEIVVEGALTHVGEGAFLNCDGLKSVSFGEGLTEIAVQAFSGCTGLRELRLPKSLLKIGENAFEDCTSLVFLIMHDTTKLSDGSFISCDALVTVYYYGTDESFDAMFEKEEETYGNEKLAEAKLYLYSAEKPTEDGYFWYMDEKGKIKLWK
jgi:hypothetical protein